MYLHIGNDNLIKQNDIIAIFSVKDKKSSLYKKLVLDRNEKLEYEESSTNRISSYILTTDKIYLSNISVATLKKRLKEWRTL